MRGRSSVRRQIWVYVCRRRGGRKEEAEGKMCERIKEGGWEMIDLVENQCFQLELNARVTRFLFMLIIMSRAKFR